LLIVIFTFSNTLSFSLEKLGGESEIAKNQEQSNKMGTTGIIYFLFGRWLIQQRKNK
tara:strand:- start:67331 stop:67501 length:171 start_codon:yes stop_codon:yes gene_type:complete